MAPLPCRVSSRPAGFPAPPWTASRPRPTSGSGPSVAPSRAPSCRRTCRRPTGILRTGDVAVDAALLDAAPALRVVSSYSVGLDGIDVAECTRRGIPVGYTPDVLTETTADVAFGLLLAAARRFKEGIDLVRQRRVDLLVPRHAAGRGRALGDHRHRGPGPHRQGRGPPRRRLRHAHPLPRPPPPARRRGPPRRRLSRHPPGAARGERPCGAHRPPDPGDPPPHRSRRRWQP